MRKPYIFKSRFVFLIILIVGHLFFGCSQDSQTVNEENNYPHSNTTIASDTINNRGEAIRKLIKRLGIITLPYREYGAFGDSIDLHDEASGKDSVVKQTLFNNPHLLLIGLLPDTSKYYSLLYYYSGDDVCPAVITLDKYGKIFSNGLLGNVTCNFCECDSCIESVVLESNYQFKREMRSMKLEQGKFVTQEHIYQVGKISNGKIVFKDSVVVK